LLRISALPAAAEVSVRAKRFPDGLGHQVSDSVQDCFLCSSNQFSFQIFIGTSARDPGIDSVFYFCPESFLLEPDSATLPFRLSEIVLYLRQNRCFFGLEEFFVQSSFGSANLKVKSVNAFCT
jgi:hypothetical protein